MEFLREIEIPVVWSTVPDDTFLPGILIDRGVLLIDANRLKFPGDILHEAGHMAIMMHGKRAQRSNDISMDAGDELGAIAWSWAALTHLELPRECVFHADGYKEDAQWLIDLFSSGNGFGVPLLQWMDLTLSPGSAREAELEPYPKMLKWLRE